MLKNTPTRETSLLRSWWPFPPLFSLISLDDVFCPLPSDLLDKTWREKKRTGNKFKKKEMKRVKSDVLPWKKLKNNWSKEIRKIQLENRRVVYFEKIKKKTEQEKKERDGLMQRMSRGRDSMTTECTWDLDSLNKVTRRSNGQDNLQACMRSSTHVNKENFVFSFLKKFLFFLKENFKW